MTSARLGKRIPPTGGSGVTHAAAFMSGAEVKANPAPLIKQPMLPTNLTAYLWISPSSPSLNANRLV